MSNSMSRALSTAWVKNVYSLRMNSGIAYGKTIFSYTVPIAPTYTTRVQPQVFTHVMSLFSAVLPTVKKNLLPLLFSQLYTLSTVPTIKKMKEIKERNS